MRHGSTLAWLGLILAFAPGVALAGEGGEASLPDSALGRAIHPLLLLSRPDVRSDLKLDAGQDASARRAIRSFYGQAYALRGKPNSAETVRARREVDEAASGWIDSQLSPEQRTRLVQVHLQWEGPSALVKRPIVAETLRLSAEQKANLAQALQRRDAAHGRGEADSDGVLAQAALRCLNESQRDTWKQMMGRPFERQVAAKAGTNASR